MYAPKPATHVRACRGGWVGICSDGPVHGLFVDYKHGRGDDPDAREALVSLRITDPSRYAADLCTVSFVVDTGAQTTVIPRHLLPEGWFPRGEARPSVYPYIVGVGGGLVPGLDFRAVVSIDPGGTGFAPLTFNVRKVFVADFDEESEEKHGLLGLDLLSTVVTVFDECHVTFWPNRQPPAQPVRT